ncbi:hypothetical protein MXMO3_03495 (plasmid) [Maritalea myrionectae]|uniref:Uncharacterized protein n=1 Tax=Maritalea myrionectae TaxID=454601 RepID=A0A2R4MJ30_9HYPH|nr:hypothetical protein MXMO3_03495 [Maritalea myrionectae]
MSFAKLCQTISSDNNLSFAEIAFFTCQCCRENDKTGLNDLWHYGIAVPLSYQVPSLGCRLAGALFFKPLDFLQNSSVTLA